MALLTEKGRQRYTLATGRSIIGACDRPACRRLIQAGELYTVVKWAKRKDGITFLGARPEKIICMRCQLMLHPIPVVHSKVAEEGTPSRKVKTALKNFFEKYYESTYSTKLLISKFQRKKKFNKVKKKEFTKALKALKKEKILQYKNKVWSLRKDVKKK